jgi:hypothetical protein
MDALNANYNLRDMQVSIWFGVRREVTPFHFES